MVLINDDTLDYRELLLVTSRSPFAEFQILLLMVYLVLFMWQLLSLVLLL
jgi:hypothetical protein